MCTPRELVYHDLPPHPRLITWRMMEALRLENLGIPNRYSRHVNIIALAGYQHASQPPVGPIPSISPRLERGPRIGGDSVIKTNNSLAPFATVGKPTCGYYFSRDTENKKVKIGIPPSNLVKWRSSSM
jgi:hypothetical protein